MLSSSFATHYVPQLSYLIPSTRSFSYIFKKISKLIYSFVFGTKLSTANLLPHCQFNEHLILWQKLSTNLQLTNVPHTLYFFDKATLLHPHFSSSLPFPVTLSSCVRQVQRHIALKYSAYVIMSVAVICGRAPRPPHYQCSVCCVLFIYFFCLRNHNAQAHIEHSFAQSLTGNFQEP